MTIDRTPDAYPITHAFEQEMEEELEDIRRRGRLAYNHTYPMFQTMVEILGEYEGGHADGLESVFLMDDVIMSQWPAKWMVKAYANICKDILEAHIAMNIND